MPHLVHVVRQVLGVIPHVVHPVTHGVGVDLVVVVELQHPVRVAIGVVGLSVGLGLGLRLGFNGGTVGVGGGLKAHAAALEVVVRRRSVGSVVIMAAVVVTVVVAVVATVVPPIAALLRSISGLGCRLGSFAGLLDGLHGDQGGPTAEVLFLLVPIGVLARRRRRRSDVLMFLQLILPVPFSGGVAAPAVVVVGGRCGCGSGCMRMLAGGAGVVGGVFDVAVAEV
mmetsp:Transcript_8738/g.22005  ORF Transcript_8738/g.22005 Transcript_8738/m.22005 type:complete len:225 (+) Transcript_8738:929-1603(+)